MKTEQRKKGQKPTAVSPKITVDLPSGTRSELDLGSPLKYHQVPGWLAKRLRLKAKELRILTTFKGLRLSDGDILQKLADGGDWLEHWGTGTYEGGAIEGEHGGLVLENGQEVFVSEPYDLHCSQIAELQAFCAMLDLDFLISAASWHYPTHTLRIILYPSSTITRMNVSLPVPDSQSLKDPRLSSIKAALCKQSKRFLSTCLDHVAGFREKKGEVHFIFDNKDSLYADLLRAGEQQETLRAVCAEVLGRPVELYILLSEPRKTQREGAE